MIAKSGIVSKNIFRIVITLFETLSSNANELQEKSDNNNVYIIIILFFRILSNMNLIILLISVFL